MLSPLKSILLLTLVFRLNESIATTIVDKMVREVAHECMRLNDLAMLKAFDLIGKGLKIQKGFKNPEKEI